MEKDSKFGLVFIYGAGLGNWIWNNISHSFNTPCLFIDYPGRDTDSKNTKGLTIHEYSALVSSKINTWQCDKIIIVAHSIGGVIALDALKNITPKVIGFIAISASIPKSGESFLSSFPWIGRMLMKCLYRMLGTKPPEAIIRNGLCNDLSNEQAYEVFNRFTPESRSIYEQKVNYNLSDIPKLYIKLTNDAAYAIALQEKSIDNLKPEKVVEINSGHLPMISKPNNLIEIIKEFTATIE
ncbi:MAG: alpha/beta fold hydrolase [Bacteroidales bacterium]